MSKTPEYAATPRLAVANLSAANTNRDGTGTVVSVIAAAGTLGTRLRRITVQALQTTTAGMVRLFVTNAGVNNLLLEIPVPAITVGANTPAFSYTVNELTDPGLLPLTLPIGWSLVAATEKAEAFRVVAEGGDL